MELNIDNLAQGAALERFKEAIGEVVQNIVDPNTEAKKVRKVTLTLSVTPDETRTMGTVSCEVKTSLVPQIGIKTLIQIGHNPRTGEVGAEEVSPVGLGQVNMLDENIATKAKVSSFKGE